MPTPEQTERLRGALDVLTAINCELPADSPHRMTVRIVAKTLLEIAAEIIIDTLLPQLSDVHPHGTDLGQPDRPPGT